MSKKMKRYIAIAWLTTSIGLAVSGFSNVIYKLYQVNQTFREGMQVVALLAIIIATISMTMWSLNTVLTKGR